MTVVRRNRQSLKVPVSSRVTEAYLFILKFDVDSAPADDVRSIAIPEEEGVGGCEIDLDDLGLIGDDFDPISDSVLLI